MGLGFGVWCVGLIRWLLGWAAVVELNQLCWCGYVIVFPMGLWWVVQGWAAAALECEFFFLG